VDCFCIDDSTLWCLQFATLGMLATFTFRHFAAILRWQLYSLRGFSEDGRTPWRRVKDKWGGTAIFWQARPLRRPHPIKFGPPLSSPFVGPSGSQKGELRLRKRTIRLHETSLIVVPARILSTFPQCLRYYKIEYVQRLCLRCR